MRMETLGLPSQSARREAVSRSIPESCPQNSALKVTGKAE